MSPSTTALLLKPEASVTCPHCEREFALAEGFAKKALEGVEAASNEALATLREEERALAERNARQIATERDAAHDRALAQMQQLTAQSYAPQIDELKRQLEQGKAQLATLAQRESALATRERGMEVHVAEAANLRATELIAEERAAHVRRSAEQDSQLRSLQAEQLALRQERQRLQDDKAAMALDVQRQVDLRVNERDAIVRSQEQERAALEKAELQKTIADMRAQIVAAQRKADQGSQQLQGEVLELQIEEALRRAFPLDAVEEVRKGQRGGDVLHRVTTRSGVEAGVILWEMKRAREWKAEWVTKLKDDMRASGAAVGIIVTMPGVFPRSVPGATLFCCHEEIWVTQIGTAIGVAEALRLGLIEVHRQRGLAAGKGEKAEALYDYMTSPIFTQKLKAIVQTFKALRDDLESERNVMTQRWARRERQLQGGMASLMGLGGEIEGISQHQLLLQEPPDEADQ